MIPAINNDTKLSSKEKNVKKIIKKTEIRVEQLETRCNFNSGAANLRGRQLPTEILTAV